jgi:hypothetical protein
LSIAHCLTIILSMNEREAQTALERVRAETVRAEKELAEQRAALVALESSAGERILTARLSEDPAAEDAVLAGLVAARARIDMSERALAASTTAIRKAQHGVGVAKAAALRDKAWELWREAEPRLEKTAVMLADLAAWEGVQYVPPPVLHPSGAFADGSFQRTQTGSILAQIIGLEQEAGHLETVSGEAVKPSLLAGLPELWRHIGAAGVLRFGPQIPPVPAKTTTPADIVRAYKDSLPLRG